MTVSKNNHHRAPPFAAKGRITASSDAASIITTITASREPDKRMNERAANESTEATRKDSLSYDNHHSCGRTRLCCRWRQRFCDFGRRRIFRSLHLTQPLLQITSSLQNNFVQNNDGGRGLPPVAAGKVGPGRLDYDFMRQRSHFGLGLSREKVRARAAFVSHGIFLIEGQWEIHVSELCG